MLELYKSFLAVLLLVVDFLAATIGWLIVFLFIDIWIGLFIFIVAIFSAPAIVWFIKENV